MTFTAPQNLHTPRLVVRLVSRDDLPALMRMNGDERVTRFLPYATWALPADGEAWFDRMDAAHATGTSLQFVIVERATSVAVGTCLIFRYEAGSARAELGYALGRDCWGRGYMAEALTALIGHAFGPMGLRRLEAEVNPDTAPRPGCSMRWASSTKGCDACAGPQKAPPTTCSRTGS